MFTFVKQAWLVKLDVRYESCLVLCCCSGAAFGHPLVLLLRGVASNSSPGPHEHLEHDHLLLASGADADLDGCAVLLLLGNVLDALLSWQGGVEVSCVLSGLSWVRAASIRCKSSCLQSYHSRVGPTGVLHNMSRKLFSASNTQVRLYQNTLLAEIESILEIQSVDAPVASYCSISAVHQAFVATVSTAGPAPVPMMSGTMLEAPA